MHRGGGGGGVEKQEILFDYIQVVARNFVWWIKHFLASCRATICPTGNLLHQPCFIIYTSWKIAKPIKLRAPTEHRLVCAEWSDFTVRSRGSPMTNGFFIHMFVRRLTRLRRCTGDVSLRWAHMPFWVFMQRLNYPIYQNQQKRSVHGKLQVWQYLSHLMRTPTKWYVRPVTTQISLGIRPDWSVFTVRSMSS